MKTINEIKQWLLENETDEYGNIDLSYIDFGDRIVNFNNIKAKEIFNNSQEADEIDNSYQEATVIYNDYQVIKPNYETMSKEELIKEIKKLKGDE